MTSWKLMTETTVIKDDGVTVRISTDFEAPRYSVSVTFGDGEPEVLVDTDDFRFTEVDDPIFWAELILRGDELEGDCATPSRPVPESIFDRLLEHGEHLRGE